MRIDERALSKAGGKFVLATLLCIIFGMVEPLSRGQTFTNPIVTEAADPWVVFHEGHYYMLATTGGDIRVRKATTLAGLAAASAVVVWTPPRVGPNAADIWAPELHYLNGKWYIYYTATTKDRNDNNRRCFVLEAKTSDPQGGYNDIGKIADPNADYYAIDGHVYVRASDGAMFFLWSGRKGDGTSDQRIYIASMSSPNKLSSGRVLLSSPTYDWERIGWAVNEGPCVVFRGGNTFILFSASGGSTPDYCLGQLANFDGNLLNPASWIKTPVPVFHKYEGPDGVCYTPGHNGFFQSPDGTETWIVYHGKENTDGTWGGRHARAQKVYWHTDGTPNLGHPIVKGVSLAVPSGEYTGTKPPDADGTGLTGEYYDNMDFTGWKSTQTDPMVNFNWYLGAPVGLEPDFYSVRWTGYVLPRFSESYTFQTYSDDGVRVWVNGNLIIDNWTNHFDTADQGTISLSGGVKHSIEVQYYEYDLTARLMLEWKSASQPFEVVPASQLYPAP